jgi:hypothetical protein
MVRTMGTIRYQEHPIMIEHIQIRYLKYSKYLNYVTYLEY